MKSIGNATRVGRVNRPNNERFQRIRTRLFSPVSKDRIQVPATVSRTHIRLLSILFAVLLIAVLSAGVGSSTVAAAEPVEIDEECTVIDEPGAYVLTSDLGASDTCLEIIADDVVLDGNGHAIVGTDDDGTGIAIRANEVTVEDVEITGWYRGIQIAGYQNDDHFEATGVTVIDSNVSANAFRGIVLGSDADGNVVRNNTVADNGNVGIHLNAANDNVISNNTVTGNGFRGVSLAGGESTGNAFEHNEIRSNNWGIGLSGVTHNEFYRNNVTDNDNVGIGMTDHDTQDNAFVENVVTDNGDAGIQVDLDSSGTFVGNEVHGNEWDVRTYTDGVAMENLYLGDPADTPTRISFVADNVEIRAAADTPENDEAASIGQYFEADMTAEGGSLEVSVHYDEGDVSHVDEGTLSLWHHDGDDWKSVSGSTVDTDAGTVDAELTAFSTFGVFGEERAPVTNVRSEETYETLAEAVAEAERGDTLELAPQTFDEDVTIDVRDLEIRGEDGTTLAGTTTIANHTVGLADLTIAGAPTGLTLESGATRAWIEDVDFVVDETGVAIEGMGLDPTVSSSTFAGNGDGAAIETDSHEAVELSVSDSTFENLEKGIVGSSTHYTSWTIRDNAFEGSDYPIRIAGGDGSDAPSVDVSGNTVSGAQTAVEVIDAGDADTPALEAIHVNRNDFTGNDQAVDATQGGGTLDAANNWWGDESGPGGEGPGSGDAVTVNVDYDPWAGSPIVDAEEITGCTVIDESGTYVLAENVTAEETCIQILETEDVVFNGLGNAVIGGDEPADWSRAILVENSSSVTVENVRTTDWGSSTLGSTNYGINARNTTDVTISNVVTDDSMMGIALWDGVDDFTVRDVRIEDTWRAGLQLAEASNGTVRNVVAADNTRMDGWQTVDVRTNTSNVVLENLTIERSLNEGQGVGVFNSAGSNITIADSTILDNDGAGISLNTTGVEVIDTTVGGNEWDLRVDANGSVSADRLHLGDPADPEVILSVDAENVQFRSDPNPPENPVAKDLGYAFEAVTVDDGQDGSRLTLSIHYDESDDDIDEKSLSIYQYDPEDPSNPAGVLIGSYWTVIKSSTVDSDAGTVDVDEIHADLESGHRFGLYEDIDPAFELGTDVVGIVEDDRGLEINATWLDSHTEWAYLAVDGEVIEAFIVHNGSVEQTIDLGRYLDSEASTESVTIEFDTDYLDDPFTEEIRLVHEAYDLEDGYSRWSIPQPAAVHVTDGVGDVTQWDTGETTYDDVDFAVNDDSVIASGTDLHRGLYVHANGTDERIGFDFAEPGEVALPPGGAEMIDPGWNLLSSNYDISSGNETLNLDLNSVSSLPANVTDYEGDEGMVAHDAGTFVRIGGDEVIGTYDTYWIYLDVGNESETRAIGTPEYDPEARIAVLEAEDSDA